MTTVNRHFYTLVSGLIFLGVGLLHGVRAYSEWEVVFNGWVVPIWFSWIVAFLGFVLALSAIKHTK